MYREVAYGPRRTAWLAVCFLIDVVIVSLFAVTLFVIATGGTVLMLGDTRIRLRTIENPVWILSLLIPLRYVLRGRGPFLARRRWSLGQLHLQSIALTEKSVSKACAQFTGKVTSTLAMLCGVSLLVKAGLA